MAPEAAFRLEIGASPNDLFLKELGALRRRLAWSLAVGEDLEGAAKAARAAVETFAAFEQTAGIPLYQAALASRLLWRIDAARGAANPGGLERALKLGAQARAAYAAENDPDEAAFMDEWLAETRGMAE